MLEERAMYLINAELDGELLPGEQAELDSVLESSAEARAMRAELQKLANLLEGMPPQDPPAGLADRIIGQIRLPARRPAFSLASLTSSFQPAQAGLAFAAGLLLTVGFYEMTAEQRSSADLSNMVGTMLADPQSRTATARDSLSIAEPGVSGTVSLSGAGGVLILDFELDSTDETEILVSLAEPGLGFGGFARAASDEKAVDGSYQVSGGTLRVVNKGQQSFSVFLLDKAGTGVGSRDISIGISMGGAPVFSGMLRG